MTFRPFSKRSDFEASADVIRDAFVKYHKALFYFSFQLLQNKKRAEDAVATAFVECWRNLAHGSDVADLEKDLYIYTQQTGHRLLNRLYRDRILADVFNKEISEEELHLKRIEAQTLQHLTTN